MTVWHGGKDVSVFMAGLRNGRRRRAYGVCSLAISLCHLRRDWAVVEACCLRGSLRSAEILLDLVARVSRRKIYGVAS